MNSSRFLGKRRDYHAMDRNRLAFVYTSIFLATYIYSFAVIVWIYGLSFKDFFVTVTWVAIFIPALAAWLTRKQNPTRIYRPPVKGEWGILLLTLWWIILYITYGSNIISQFLRRLRIDNQQWLYILVILRKIFIFVFIPFLVYRSLGFSLKDFGLSLKRALSRNELRISLFISPVLLLFQYLFSQSGTRLHLTPVQWIAGTPLCFISLCIEVGLVEEFFFRGLLQSRLTVLLRSEWGAILISGLLFGIAHVPGLFLRGASSEGVAEHMPLLFWLSYCIVNMSAAGIFLGIIWARTRNLYLVIALHAIVDLLPNLADFVKIWKI